MGKQACSFLCKAGSGFRTQGPQLQCPHFQHSGEHNVGVQEEFAQWIHERITEKQGRIYNRGGFNMVGSLPQYGPVRSGYREEGSDQTTPGVLRAVRCRGSHWTLSLS